MTVKETDMKDWKEYIVPITNEGIAEFEELHGTYDELIRCEQCEYRDSSGMCFVRGFNHMYSVNDDDYCSKAVRIE